MTFDCLKAMFDAHSNNVDKKIGDIQDSINSLQTSPPVQSVVDASGPGGDVDVEVSFAGTVEEVRARAPDGSASTYCVCNYTYDGRLGWHVPKNFEFPARCKLDIGWKLWLQGLPSNQIIGTDGKVQAAPIQPFWKFNPELLPKKI